MITRLHEYLYRICSIVTVGAILRVDCYLHDLGTQPQASEQDMLAFPELRIETLENSEMALRQENTHPGQNNIHLRDALAHDGLDYATPLRTHLTVEDPHTARFFYGPTTFASTADDLTR